MPLGVEFDHLDGMYSYCPAFNGEGQFLGIVHLAGFTPLEVQDDGYRIATGRRGEIMSEAAAELLEKAAAEIDQRGWCQGTLENKDGQVCTIGALVYAACGTLDCAFARSKAWWEARNLLAELHGNIPAYNNAPGRSIEDIQLWFKEAAEQARLG